ncbi:MAG TPA: aspartate kinase [Bacteroidota bacterium]|nr:aspartate kinase [Bacteroidota bacterium]
MITMKFGGTSVQDADAISNVVTIVRKALPRRPVVIISAIAQATNTLEKIGKAACEGNGTLAHDEIEALLRRHVSIVNRLITDQASKKALVEDIAGAGVSLNRLTSGVEKLRELTPRTMDAFYAFGELLSSKIVAAALADAGIPSAWLDTKDFMVTDDNFTCARPLMDIMAPRLEAAVSSVLGEGHVPVTQGFIGVTTAGHRTTMGRESSDFTGSLIGSVLGAESIEIWTDVAGVLSADPRVVESPSRVGSMSFSEAYELTYFGAKVLHPGTMLPAEAKDIPIDILKSGDPSMPGTRVSAAGHAGAAVVRSITYRQDVAVLTLTPRRREGQYIFWEHVFGVLTGKRAETLLMNAMEYQLALVLRSAEACGEIMDTLKDLCVADLRTGKSLVCAVGENIVAAPGIPARFLAAVGQRPVYFYSHGASKNSLVAAIDSPGTEDVVRSLHAEFFGRAASR